jgi:epoxide hydrolase-like predicted phosphatase
VIRAVAFDVGGVLCPSPVDEFGKVDREYGLPQGTLESFVRGGDDWMQLETGGMAIGEFYDRCTAQILADHGVAVPHARLQAMLDACMGDSMRREMRDLVLELEAGGYRIALLTNIYAERRDWLRSLFPEGVIDVFCDSSEVGLRKPEPPIYRKLLELLELPAEEVAFLDDFEENVVAAREAGIVGIRFEGTGQARRELATLGVRVRASEALT